MRELTLDRTAALREALTRADYTVGAVHGLLGDTGHRALLRNETTPALRATGDGSRLATLTRLFALGAPVAADAAAAALPVPAMLEAGLLERSVDEVRALVDVRAYGDEDNDWWVVCDLMPGLDGRRPAVRGDHVLGISSTSTSLAQLSVRHRVGRALDLGTGCGVQSLHLGQHADEMVATDVNPRALTMARMTSQLNEVAFEVRDGSLYEPVAGERFDLIVTNPPFVVSPGTEERLVYRDSGLPGDEVVQRVVSQSSQHLNDGGWCQVLANWVHRRGQDWRERVEGWIPSDCDAWVLQRECVDVPTYVEMWLADAGLAGADDYTESVGEPGSADPGRIVLRLQRGVRRARQVDTVERASWVPATATSRSGSCSTRSPISPGAGPRRCAPTTCRGSASWWWMATPIPRDCENTTRPSSPRVAVASACGLLYPERQHCKQSLVIL